MERLDKFLCDSGVGTRSQVKVILKSGRVAVDGRVEKDNSRKIDPATQCVTLDGEVLGGKRRIVAMLNKPAGYTCSASDPHAEHLAVELIDVPQRIFYAGRLDRDSEGLLIFSNDGNYVQELAHPRYGVEKLYRVSVSRPLSSEDMAQMCAGIADEDGTVRALEVKPAGKNTYTFLLNEGKKREIRRLVRAVGSRVVRLIRVRQGKLELGNLSSGKWRYLSKEEAMSARENPEK